MTTSHDTTSLLNHLELKEYESTALEHLLSLGRTTAPNLAEATDIPKARIYGVLDSLNGMGYIKTIPGRPKQYQPKSPAESSIEPKRTSDKHTNPIDKISSLSEMSFSMRFSHYTSNRVRILRLPKNYLCR